MRALVKRGVQRRLHLEDVPEPVAGPDDVVVEVSCVGICGTDFHILHDVYDHADPVIPGHELAGRIAHVGKEVRGWSIGDRVVSELHTGADRTCPICRSGNPQICPSKRALGTWTNGAFAERVALPAWLLHRLPEDIPDDLATLIEPGACSIHAMMERSRVHAGDMVLVTGHGPIGLLCAQVALAESADLVILSGRSRKGSARLDAARHLGVEVVDVDCEPVARRVRKLTNDRGVDVAVEAAGAADALADCVAACRPGARVAVLGLIGSDTVAFPWDTTVMRDLEVSFSFSSRESSWQRAIELMESGRLGEPAMVTHSFALEDWEQAFSTAGSGEAVKVLLRP
jgi:2-desacetyl-2-hydroxyethyl bacteriochlorophyllide A dehydrogenase